MSSNHLPGPAARTAVAELDRHIEAALDAVARSLGEEADRARHLLLGFVRDHLLLAQRALREGPAPPEESTGFEQHSRRRESVYSSEDAIDIVIECDASGYVPRPADPKMIPYLLAELDRIKNPTKPRDPSLPAPPSCVRPTPPPQPE
jgi:hypothetical protein